MLSLQQICGGSPAAAAAAAGAGAGICRGSAKISSPKKRSSSIRAASAAATMESVAAMRTMPKSLYDVLGVPQQSDIKEIKSAYRHLARATHPDVAAVENKEESTKEFLRIHAAYTTLSDPRARARYDLQLSLQSVQRFSPRGGFSGFGYDYAAGSPAGSPAGARVSPQWKTSKSWETDQCW